MQRRVFVIQAEPNKAWFNHKWHYQGYFSPLGIEHDQFSKFSLCNKTGMSWNQTSGLLVTWQLLCHNPQA